MISELDFQAFSDLLFEEFFTLTRDTAASWRVVRLDTLIDLFLMEVEGFIMNCKKDQLYKASQYLIMFNHNFEFGVLDLPYYSKKDNLESKEIEKLLAKCREKWATIFEGNLSGPHGKIQSEYLYLKELRNHNYELVIIDTLRSVLLAMLGSFSFQE